jgi:hypothetical protein
MNVTFTEKNKHSYSVEWSQGEDGFKGWVHEYAVSGTIEDNGEFFTFSGLYVVDCGETSWEDLKVIPVLGSEIPEDAGFDTLQEAIDYYTDHYADELGEWV